MEDNGHQMGNEDQSIDIKLPLQLIERVQNYCRKQNITIDHFIMDAVTAKLQLANQERRKRQRL